MKAGLFKLYYADVRPLLNEALQKKVYSRLPLVRQLKADACLFPDAKAASLAAGFLMEYALKKQELQTARIEYAKNGAPLILSADRKLYISVSHSGDYAACVISDKPVGVDIQQFRKVRRGVLRHFCSEEEKNSFWLPYEKTDEDVFLSAAAAEIFMRQWAAKESYMKMTGEGMQLGFDQLVFENDGQLIRDRKERYRSALVRQYQVLDGYCLAVCIED